MDSSNKSETCFPQHGLEALGRRLRRVKGDVDIQKHQLCQLKGEVREIFQQVAEDLHEVRSIQRKKNDVEESQNQEQSHAFQELTNRLTHVDI